MGSSPRVWGQEHSVTDAIGDSGIIPTRMGTSLRLPLTWIKSKDHPHAYGDKDINKLCTVGADGSSPRVWGQGYGKEDLQ